MSTIRKANLQDLDQLSELFDLYRIFYKKESNIKAGKEFLKERIIKNESEIFISIVDSKAVGFVQLYPYFSSTRMKKMWLLNDLFVLPEYRGKGISKELIETSKKLCIATKACALNLETSKMNDIGNSLYPSVGFELDAGTNFYFWTNKN